MKTRLKRSKVHARQGRAAVVLTMVVAVVAALATATPSGANAARSHHDKQGDHSVAFRQVNLVSDIPGLAKLHDPEVKNPWGIAMGPTTPLWVSNNFNPASDCGSPDCLPRPRDLLTKSTLYAGANGHAPISKVPLEVTTSTSTGIVFNPTSKFVINQDGTRTPALFLFNETFVNSSQTGPEGRITGWSNVPAPAARTKSTPARDDPGFPVGLALVPAQGNGHGPRLLVADGIDGGIHVFNSRFMRVNNPRLFADPHAAEDGLGAYNVTFLRHRVYVSYFADSGGAVSVFSARGMFIKRLVTGAPLFGPWGMAIAPKHWDRFGGKLLVGNVDDGMIHAFNRHTGHLVGTVRDATGRPLVNPGLWGLAFGNGTIGTKRTLLFAAGIGEDPGGFGDEVYEHGLVGLIRPVAKDN